VARARWTILAAVAALALAAVGCGGASKSGQVKEIAIATPGGAGDIGWSQQGIGAARRVASERELRLRTASGLEEGSFAAALERLAKDGAGLVIAHGRHWAPAAAAVAAKTKVPELVFGAPERLEPGRVGDVEVATEQAGYLAGYIAARASYIPSVGIIVASDDPLWYRTAGAFIAGARRFNPHVKITYARVGTDDDNNVMRSRSAAEAQIADKTQMLLGLGERSTFGVMQATENALNARGARHFDAMFVDVIGDKSARGHRSLTGLTAMIWNFAPAYRQAIADLRAGRFGRHPYTLDLANGGLSLIHDGRTPMDNYEAAMALGRRIAAGKLKVPVTTTNAQVVALLHEQPRS
jgi:basic membrane protein A and related proteins